MSTQADLVDAVQLALYGDVLTLRGQPILGAEYLTHAFMLAGADKYDLVVKCAREALDRLPPMNVADAPIKELDRLLGVAPGEKQPPIFKRVRQFCKDQVAAGNGVPELVRLGVSVYEELEDYIDGKATMFYFTPQDRYLYVDGVACSLDQTVEAYSITV